MSRVAGASLYVMNASGSDPWNDVTHEGSVDPVCNVIIHIYNLEKLRNFRVLALPMMLTTSAICQVPFVFLMITAIPALTWRKTGSVFWGGETLFALSDDIHLFT